MKLKAVLKEDCRPVMKAAVESAEFRNMVIRRVLVAHLHMKETIGPAEFYIQKSDYAVGSTLSLCEVRLSGVSVTKKRATDDYYRARHVLERLYADQLHPLLENGEPLQLMVSLMLDQPPFGEKTSLIERTGGPAIWIKGGVPLPVWRPLD